MLYHKYELHDEEQLIGLWPKLLRWNTKLYKNWTQTEHKPIQTEYKTDGYDRIETTI